MFAGGVRRLWWPLANAVTRAVSGQPLGTGSCLQRAGRWSGLPVECCLHRPDLLIQQWATAPKVRLGQFAFCSYPGPDTRVEGGLDCPLNAA